MRIHYLTLVLFCTFSGNFGVAQTSSTIKELADLEFAHGKYHAALENYKSLQKDKPNNIDMKYRMGVCYFEIGQIQTAEQYLLFVANQKGGNSEAWYYLGRVFHMKSFFKDAILYYKKYLKEVNSGQKREYAKHCIRQCAAAREIKYQKELAIVDNLGTKVNGPLNDYAPVTSPGRENTIYFSSERKGNSGGLRDLEGLEDEIIGQYKADIFSSQLINGEWTATRPLNSQINSSKNDEVLGFSDNATVMYYYKGNLPALDGTILTDTLRNTEAIIYPREYRSPVKVKAGDETPYFYNNEVIIYASRQEGGFGGLDLYLTRRLPGGFWTRPENLGPEINTPFDEKSPFLAKDGRTLYYSSNQVASLGGFDIFKNVFRGDIVAWSEATNMGAPINSPGDDLYFTMAGDGLKSFLVSDRIGGAGGKDIYVGYFKTVQREQLLNEKLFFNLEQSPDMVGVNNGSNNATKPSQPINNAERKNIVLSPLFYVGDNVITNVNITELNKVVKLAEKYPLMKIELAGHTDDTDPEKFRLYFSYLRTEKVADYLTKNGVKSDNIIIKGLGSNYPTAKNKNPDGSVSLPGQKLNKRIEIRLMNIETAPLNVTIKWPIINERLKEYKRSTYDNSLKGLTYKIQVAALKSMYDSDIIIKYGDSMLEKDSQRNLLRYTVGLYRTYSSARQLANELKSKGVTNAFVIPYIDGVRLDPRDAESMKGTYADLLNYINRSR